MNENKNNENEKLNNSQSTWSEKFLNWMSVDMPKTTEISDQNFEFEFNKNSTENEVPKILVNNTDMINTSNEFSSLSDSTETHLVTITRLQEKGGLGNLIRKLRTGFKKDDNLTRFWMPDSNSKECSECNFKFSTLRRKHHCRICGQIFCSKCCSKEIDGSKVGYLDNRQVRSCDNCFKAVTYCDVKFGSTKNENSSDTNLNTISELDNSYEYLPQTFRNLFKDDTTYTLPYDESSRYKSPRRSIEENLIQRRSSMVKNDNKPAYKFNSAIKEEKINKVLFFSSEENNEEPIWQKKVDQKENISFENIETEVDSSDFAYESDEEKNYFKKLYKNEDNEYKSVTFNTYDDISNENISINKKKSLSEVDSADLSINQKKRSESSSAIYVDDHLNEDLINSMPSFFEKKEENELKNLNQEESFDKVYDKMFEQLTYQLLKKDKLSLNWIPVLKKIVIDVTKSVKPNNDNLEEMDVRRHVKIKTITGGNKTDSCIINGVVFTKNVAHRKMRKEIENPKILLLSCPITYQQRTYQKFISFEKLFLQENSYLENLIEKIVSFKSNIIILDKIVSTKAQELLLKKKITLIFNVKPNILYKLSRLTGGEIISSIDAQITTPKFGECSTFYLKSFSNQTLMFFDGCKPESGCTILLRGSVSKKELKKVKNILQFLIFCNFNWKYEKEFLLNSSVYLSLNLLNEFNDHYDNSKNKEDLDKKIELDRSFENKNSKKSSLISLDPLSNNGSENKLKVFNLDTKINSEINNIFENSDELNFNMCSFIKEQVLNISPFLFCKLPYLLTNESESCLLKQYLTNESLFNSISFKNYLNLNKICLLVDDVVYKKEEILSENVQTLSHPFLTADLKNGPNNEYSQELRAMYRSSDLFEINIKNLDGSLSEENEIIDPFDITLHQLFPVLYCNYSLKSNQNPFCIQPRIILMEFYVKKDFSLGDYLKNFCFTTNTKCDCGSLNIDHISKFSHACGSIHVRCKKLEKKIDKLNSKDILTWSWCQLCKTTSPSQVLSKNALSLSFGKLLQLKIYGSHFRRLGCETSCSNHSLFHDHFQFFAYQNLVASFKYYPVIIREIVLPCFKLNIKIEIVKINQLSLDFQKLKSIGYDIMSKIVEKICAYQAESDLDNDNTFKSMFKTEMINRSEFKSKIVEIQDLIQLKTANLQNRLTIMNKLILLKKFISGVVNFWNNNFNDFEAFRKKEERSNVRNIKTLKVPSLEADSHSNLIKQISKAEIIESIIKPDNTSMNINGKIIDSLASKNLDKTNSIIESNNQNEIFDNYLEEQLKDFDLKEDESSIKTFSTDNEEETNKKLNSDITESSESISSIVFGLTPGIKAGLGKEIDFNCESDKENYEIVHSHVESKLDFEKNSFKTNSIENTKLEDTDEKKNTPKNDSKIENISSQTQASLFKSQVSVSSKKELNVPLMKTFINTFLSVPSVSIIPEPFDLSIHYLLPTKEKLPIVLKDNDVGSIIAYTLTTNEYDRKISELKTNDSTKNKRLNSFSNNLNNINNIENIKETLNKEFINSSTNTFQNTKENSVYDINIQFNDHNTNYSCCIYFAYQFCELRSNVLTVSKIDSKKPNLGSSKNSNDHQDSQENFLFDTEEAYIRSISQTVDWLAKGGKSNALFGKTLNDRFVIKIVSKTDLQFFLQMAKSYFSYIKRSINESKPTLFAKIIGAYHVSWKNNLDNSTMKKYVLIMENLFYNRNIKQKFDLKGSEKNRLATTKTSDDVLLDENLTKIIRDNPFYILNHSKKVLKEAIDNDSKFLCYLNVIDYSLLVGIDEEKKEIVLGIIDYLQTYTNIKKLENVIKSMGKVMPTVVDPKSYRIRFQNKMNEYFQCLPDQWYCFDVFSLN